MKSMLNAKLLISDELGIEDVKKCFDSKWNVLMVIDKEKKLVGIIGIREYENIQNLMQGVARDVCNKKYLYVFDDDEKEERIRKIFNEYGIYYLPIIDYEGHIVDVIHRVEYNKRYNHFLSYAQDMEDVILSWVLQEEENIFYIDVGANDPWIDSVTKWLYEKGARGINIEPQKECWEKLKADRPRDITLCCGAGSKEEEMIFYKDGGLSTCVEKLRTSDAIEMKIPIYTLTQICEKYMSEGQNIHFLKIDVEGFEGEVLRGMDFKKYRPWLIVLESVDPITFEPSYSWEEWLLQQGYQFVKQYGINRYYLANEKSEYCSFFLEKEEIEKKYYITQILWH